jgi:tetratricopeptide (TPR) repeat protein
MNNVKNLLNRLDFQPDPAQEPIENIRKNKKLIRLYLLIFILISLVVIYFFMFHQKPVPVKPIQTIPNPPILNSIISIKKISIKRTNTAILKKSTALIKTHKIKGAILLLEKNKPSNISDDPNYFALLASLYLSQQNIDAAYHLYQDLLQYDNTQGIWWIGLGMTLQKKGDYLLAKNAFSQAQECQNLSPVWRSFIETQLQN